MLHCHSAILPPAPTPHPQQPLICFLSLQISLHFQQFYINGNIQTTSVLIWLLLLGIIFLNYIHIVAGISCLFPSIAKQYSTICIHHNLFIQSPIDELLGYFQFGPINNNTPVNILIHIFRCTSACISLRYRS